MSTIDQAINHQPYYVMRAALALFQKTPDELDTDQLQKAKAQADNEYRIESRVLKSQEADKVVISEQMLTQALQEIRNRFADEGNFIETLSHNQLDPKSLQSALYRQCKVERVMDIVATRVARVSDAEVDIFYHMHPEKFNQPEVRSAAHILITINEDFPENTRQAAEQRITELAQKLAKKPHLFSDTAMKYSECPTAMQGGELGKYGKGKLYPEIDEVLFKLKEGQISDVILTETGFHIVKCLKVHVAQTISLKKARPKIRKTLQDRQQRQCQRAWLASLPSEEKDPNATNH